MNKNKEQENNIEIIVAVCLLAILILFAGDTAVFGQVMESGDDVGDEMCAALYAGVG